MKKPAPPTDYWLVHDTGTGSVWLSPYGPDGWTGERVRVLDGPMPYSDDDFAICEECNGTGYWPQGAHDVPEQAPCPVCDLRGYTRAPKKEPS